MRQFRITTAGEWEHFVSRSFYPLALSSIATDFTAVATVTELGGGIRVAELSTAASGLRRTRRLVASSPSDELLFLLQLTGEARIEQADRQLALVAGHATFCDPSIPYAVTESCGQQIVAMVPRQEVLPPRSNAADIRLHALSMNLAPLRVFRLLAEEIVSDPGSGHELERSGVARAAADLIRSAATIVSAAESDIRPWSCETRLRAVKEYLLARLGDPGITMNRVAAANGISVRQLTAIFEPDDSPAAFLRRERMRRAREELRDPHLLSVPIAAIGARWGYPNPSTFGRAYRREFGQTPADARVQAFGADRDEAGDSVPTRDLDGNHSTNSAMDSPISAQAVSMS